MPKGITWEAPEGQLRESLLAVDGGVVWEPPERGSSALPLRNQRTGLETRRVLAPRSLALHAPSRACEHRRQWHHFSSNSERGAGRPWFRTSGRFHATPPLTFSGLLASWPPLVPEALSHGGARRRTGRTAATSSSTRTPSWSSRRTRPRATRSAARFGHGWGAISREVQLSAAQEGRKMGKSEGESSIRAGPDLAEPGLGRASMLPAPSHAAEPNFEGRVGPARPHRWHRCTCDSDLCEADSSRTLGAGPPPPHFGPTRLPTPLPSAPAGAASDNPKARSATRSRTIAGPWRAGSSDAGRDGPRMGPKAASAAASRGRGVLVRAPAPPFSGFGGARVHSKTRAGRSRRFARSCQFMAGGVEGRQAEGARTRGVHEAKPPSCSPLGCTRDARGVLKMDVERSAGLLSVSLWGHSLKPGALPRIVFGVASHVVVIRRVIGLVGLGVGGHLAQLRRWSWAWLEVSVHMGACVVCVWVGVHVFAAILAQDLAGLRTRRTNSDGEGSVGCWPTVLSCLRLSQAAHLGATCDVELLRGAPSTELC